MKRPWNGDLRQDIPIIISEFTKAGFVLVSKIKSRKSRSVYLMFSHPNFRKYDENVLIRVSDHEVGTRYNSQSGDMESYSGGDVELRIDHYIDGYVFEKEVLAAIKDALYCVKIKNGTEE